MFDGHKSIEPGARESGETPTTPSEFPGLIVLAQPGTKLPFAVPQKERSSYSSNVPLRSYLQCPSVLSPDTSPKVSSTSQTALLKNNENPNYSTIKTP